MKHTVGTPLFKSGMIFGLKSFKHIPSGHCVTRLTTVRGTSALEKSRTITFQALSATFTCSARQG